MRSLPVRVPIAVGLILVFASVTNIYGSRFGIVPDMILLGAAITAFVWLGAYGFESQHTSLFLAVICVLLALYLVLSVYHFSYRGIRNAASLFSVAAIFLFFFNASQSLLNSRIFLGAAITGFLLLVLLRELPLDIAKNMLNSAMCYYLVLIFLCLTKLKSIRLWNVSALFATTFVLSMLNNHRTLAALSILLTFQFAVLNLNIARVQIRTLMFAGIVLCGVGVVSVLVNPDMLIFANAFNDLLASEGERTIMSGRQVIWPALWDEIMRNPILGLEPGASTSDLYATTLSAHNYFLEIGLQLGFTGIVLVIVMFWSLWRMTYPSRDLTLAGAENFLTVLVTMVAVHCLFDVFLTQDSLAVGVPIWMALGLGLGGLASESRRSVRILPAGPLPASS